MCVEPVDRLNFPINLCGNEDITIITDQFTNGVGALEVLDRSIATTARRLVEEFIARFGAPFEIHTKQGRGFQSDVCKAVFQLLGVTQTMNERV